MALDVTGLIIIAVFFIRGYTRGFIVATFSVLAILLGILCALKLSQSFGAWLLEKGYTTATWAPMVSYLVLFTGVVLLVRMVAKMIKSAMSTLKLGELDKAGGGLLYGLAGAIVWSSVLWMGAKMNMFGPELIAASKTYPFMSQLAPGFFAGAGHLLPFAKDVFSNLSHFFDQVQKK